jgi:hypothetical protein
MSCCKVRSLSGPLLGPVVESDDISLKNVKRDMDALLHLFSGP